MQPMVSICQGDIVDRRKMRQQDYQVHYWSYFVTNNTGSTLILFSLAYRILFLDTFCGHMQKFERKFKKFQTISGFQNFVQLRVLITLAYKNNHNSLAFKDTELIFYMQS